MIWLFLACADPGTVMGTVLDARTRAPVVGVEVVASAAKASDACRRFSATTDEEGSFRIADLCGGEAYTLQTAGTWQLAEPPTVAGAEPPAQTLQAWPVPEVEGVFLFDGKQWTALKTHTAIETARIFGTDRTVSFPAELPGTLPRVAGETVLVVAGQALIEGLSWAPLVPSGKRWFGDRAAPEPVDPWIYLGVRFIDDTVVEEVPPGLDMASVTTITLGDRVVRYIPAAALGRGRHALLTPRKNRAFLLEFGEKD